VLRPPSRNVKLTLFSYCMALLGVVSWAASRHGAVWWWSRRREQLLSASIISWAQNRERADGAGGEHPPAGLLMSRTPFQSLAWLLSRGDRYATVAIDFRQPNVEKPLQATSDGSVSRSQEVLHFSHASSLRIVSVLCRSPACSHALHLPQTIARCCR
jgi:hypothetical protein